MYLKMLPEHLSLVRKVSFLHALVCYVLYKTSYPYSAWLSSWKAILIVMSVLMLVLAIVWANTDCFQLGLCRSKSLPSVSHFVGREEDIRNITGYLDFSTSDVQVVHIVGPPGFGKSTLAMKIGEIFVRKWVNVHYVDVRQKMVRDIDTLSEKIVLTMVEFRKNKVTFNDLEDKIRTQYANTLIILDNCDELFEYSKEEFSGALKSLTLASPQKHVKYLLTSQKWVADIGSFQLHAIYNLSNEAAIELLGRVAPSLADDQKRQIADYTGNVPLALDVIGAIFKFPDAPSAESIIQGLKKQLLRTLSPPELPYSNVDISISLAYSYLTPELQQLCVNLSHFPGSFNEECASCFFQFSDSMQLLHRLVQRSLVQSSHGRQRYYIHQLLKKFFQSQGSGGKMFQQYFNTMFQLYFTGVLHDVIHNSVDLTALDEEKHNINHMFTLFKSAKDVNITFKGIKVAVHAIKGNILQLRFLQTEIHSISQNMLTVLDSYTPDEQAMVMFFPYTYIELMMLVAEQKWSLSKADAIKTLVSRGKRIDKWYQGRVIHVSDFTKFYNVLAWYYMKIGDHYESTICHTHILTTIHGQLRHCSPNCDYLSVSDAYENIGDRRKAFDFRVLAFRYQLHYLDDLEKAELILNLYNDYSNESLGNDTIKADSFSAIIINDIYPYLISTHDYIISEVFYAAVDFFRAKNMEEQVVQLQNAIINNTDSSCTEESCVWSKNTTLTNDQDYLKSRCKLICAARHAHTAQENYYRKCFHVAIWFGRKSYMQFKEIAESNVVGKKYEPALFIGMSYYEISNYSEAQVWLELALQDINIAIRNNYFSHELRFLRAILCVHLLAVNGNILCIAQLTKDTMGIMVGKLYWLVLWPYTLWEYLQQDTMITSTETALTKQTNKFVSYASSYFDHIRYRINLTITLVRIIFASLFNLFFCCVLCRTCCVDNVIYHTRRFIYRFLILSTIIISLLCTDWI